MPIVPIRSCRTSLTCAVRMRQPLGRTKVSIVAHARLAFGTHSRGVRGTLASTIVVKISR